MDPNDLMGSSEIKCSFIHIRTAYIFHKGPVCGFCPCKMLLYFFGVCVFLHPSNLDQGEMLSHINLAKYKFVF